MSEETNNIKKSPKELADEKISQIIERLEIQDYDEVERFDKYLESYKFEKDSPDKDKEIAQVCNLIQDFKFGSFEVIKVKSEHESLANISDANLAVAFIQVYRKITQIIDLRYQETNLYVALQAIINIFINYTESGDHSKARTFLFSLIHKTELKISKFGRHFKKIITSETSMADLHYLDLIVLAAHCFITIAENDGFLALLPKTMVKKYKNPEDVIRVIYNCDKILFKDIFMKIVTEK